MTRNQLANGTILTFYFHYTCCRIRSRWHFYLSTSYSHYRLCGIRCTELCMCTQWPQWATVFMYRQTDRTLTQWHTVPCHQHGVSAALHCRDNQPNAMLAYTHSNIEKLQTEMSHLWWYTTKTGSAIDMIWSSKILLPCRKSNHPIRRIFIVSYRSVTLLDYSGKNI